jgi:hypothetical protein
MPTTPNTRPEATMTAPLPDPQLAEMTADRNRFRAAWNNARSRAQSHAADLAYTAELGGQVIKAEAQAVRDLEAENARLRAALERQDGEARFWEFEHRASMDNYWGEIQKGEELRAKLILRDAAFEAVLAMDDDVNTLFTLGQVTRTYTRAVAATPTPACSCHAERVHQAGCPATA